MIAGSQDISLETVLAGREVLKDRSLQDSRCGRLSKINEDREGSQYLAVEIVKPRRELEVPHLHLLHHPQVVRVQANLLSMSANLVGTSIIGDTTQKKVGTKERNKERRGIEGVE